MKSSEQFLLQQLKAGDEEAFKTIYLRHRESFIGWLVAQQCPFDQAADLYQLTILILYDNVVSGKLSRLNSSLKTYLYSIGRHKWLELQRRQNRFQQLLDQYFFDHIDPSDLEDREEYELLLNLVADCLEDLGEPCKSLLESFYLQNLSMDEIREIQQYKNANSAKNQKYKCLKRLRKIFLAKLENSDFPD